LPDGTLNNFLPLDRHDLNTNLCGTVLFADDEFVLVGVDTGYEITFAIQQLRLIGH
jgi:hypothetical protein